MTVVATPVEVVTKLGANRENVSPVKRKLSEIDEAPVAHHTEDDEESVHTEKKCNYPGVYFDHRRKTWVGCVTDSNTRIEYTEDDGTQVSKAKRIYVSATGDEGPYEVYCKLVTLKAFVNEQTEDRIKDMAEKEPTTRGLQMGPENPSYAEKGVAYWRPNYKKNDNAPYRCVIGSAGKRGVRWRPCCEHFDANLGRYTCSSQGQAQTSSIGVLCVKHAKQKRTRKEPSDNTADTPSSSSSKINGEVDAMFDEQLVNV
jgi:hypothetical protein